jgi:hypothetical protein
VSGYFNVLARAADAPEINLEELRKSLESEADHQVSLWTSRTHVDTFSALGDTQEMHAAVDRHLLLCQPKSSEPKSVKVSVNTAGEIRGRYVDANNAHHSFAYDANGTRTD